jgi:REP element-mobilizing transposase RayT
MPRSKRNYQLNTYYHLYNRGNRKQIVFYDSQDYQTFLDYLYYYANLYKVEVSAHCLMPNHFHLAVRSLYVANNISKMMQSAMTKFCVYINKKYHMVGRTFQGTYKHTVIDTKYSFHRLMRYFKNNPVKAGMVKKGEYYKWLQI